MATISSKSIDSGIDYPDSDGQPMAETPQHRDNLAYLIEMLRFWFGQEEMVYISGNMFIYYVPGNRLRHMAPDVFVVIGIPKTRIPERRRFLVWEEGKGPDFIIELTSPTTREEDLEDKFQIYQNTLKVREYFLFDPHGEYLDPPLQGFRLVEGRYLEIQPVEGRLPSEVLGLHLERVGWQLRLYNPATGRLLPTPPEEREALKRAEAEKGLEKTARQEAEAEVERLRRELEDLRQNLRKQS